LQVIDIVLLVLLGIGAYGGYRRGFVVEGVGTLSWIVAIVAGFILLDLGMAILEPLVGKTWLLPRITYFCIFVCTIWFLTYSAKWIRGNIKKTLLGDFDSWAGGIFGLLKMAFILSVICWFGTLVKLKPKNESGKKLYVYPVVAPIAPVSAKVFMAIMPPAAELKKAVTDRFNNPV